MPAAPLIVEWGLLDENALQRDEFGLLVSKCDIAAKRDWKTFKGSNEADSLVRGTNPTLEISMTAIAVLTDAGDYQGLATSANGQRIASLNALNNDPFGHDQSEGLLLLKDPKIGRDETNAPSLDLNFTHYPFCIPQTGDPAALAA